MGNKRKINIIVGIDPEDLNAINEISNTENHSTASVIRDFVKAGLKPWREANGF